ncbi:MAG: ribonuclease H-like domain-containing protein [Sandaracinaceae bacterium]|nr:ribonuclease H-like domain-containing protein [Sandaracinaceae bacterium]
MKLKDKLSRLTSPGPRTVPALVTPSLEREAPAEQRVHALRSMLGQMMTRDLKREPVPAASVSRVHELPGQVRETEHGRVRFVERFCEPAHCHGRVPVSHALRADSSLVAKLALDPAFENVDMRGMLLIDTETTGLAGGSGTIPFLIGMAWFEDESLRVQQLFLERPGEEAPMLREAAARMTKATCIVSYNGKSFDWPLLRTRYVLNRVAVPAPPPHLDLLHCARRVFKRSMPGMRLQHLEREVLGLYREDDIDGSQIPAAYLSFLRGIDASRIAAVIEHNGSDLIALAAVLVALGERFHEVRSSDDPREHLSLAHLAMRADDGDRAWKFARAASTGGMDAVAAEAYALLAHLSKEKGDDAGAGEALRTALTHCNNDEEREGTIHLALAKLYEHRLKNYALALVHAAQATNAEGEEASRKRVARLQKRTSQSALL